MKKIILIIDTSSNKVVKVGLQIDDEAHMLEQTIDHRKAQAVLPMAEQLLTEHKLTIQDVTNIEVTPGPGSFTGLRVGVAIANALGFLLKVSVNGKPVGEFVEPVYS